MRPSAIIAVCQAAVCRFYFGRLPADGSWWSGPKQKSMWRGEGRHSQNLYLRPREQLDMWPSETGKLAKCCSGDWSGLMVISNGSKWMQIWNGGQFNMFGTIKRAEGHTDFVTDLSFTELFIEEKHWIVFLKWGKKSRKINYIHFRKKQKKTTPHWSTLMCFDLNTMLRQVFRSCLSGCLYQFYENVGRIWSKTSSCMCQKVKPN